MDTVLPKNRIVPRSEYVVNDMYNVTRVGEEIYQLINKITTPC